MKIFGRIILLIMGLIVIGIFANNYIHRVRNYPDAYAIKEGNQQFIKLKGRRKLMVHDPISLLLNKTYEDTTLLPVSTIKDTFMNGKTIPVAEGYYKFTGTVTIKGDSLTVNLSTINTDDKVLSPSDWNGKYILHKPKNGF